MSKLSLKRVLIAAAIVLVGVILIVSGTVSINILNLVNWFKDFSQGVWARLAPIIPLKEILCFLAGVILTLIIKARKGNQD